jgi:hypothetical protein
VADIGTSHSFDSLQALSSNGLVTRQIQNSAEFQEAFKVDGFPLLEFDRRPVDRHLLIGFVLTWNAKLTLIQPIETEQFLLKGYSIFSNADVKRWRPVSKDDFVARAAVLHKLRPRKPAGVRIASTKEALASVGKAFPLVTIHTERVKRGVCYVGRVLQTSQRALTLLSISPQADWDEEETYLLKDITLIDFGGTYEGLLARMAKK